MNPRAYRKLRKLTLKQMADLVGAAHESVVSKHERGALFPSPRFVQAYQEVSEGAVRYEDWVDVRNAARRAPVPMAS